jgi:hypothetical protein
MSAAAIIGCPHPLELTCAREGCERRFVQRSWQHRFCSTRCKDAHHEASSPNHRHNNRLRCSRWAAEHRGVRSRQPWLLGEPPFESHLPGAGFEMWFSPSISFDHRHISALHGVLTSLTGEHHPNNPRFSLVPWPRGCGWGVYLAEPETVETLAGTRHVVRLGTGSPELAFGKPVRIRSPRIVKRGHRQLRIDAITPVCVRHSTGEGNAYQIHTAPTASNLLSTLQFMTLRRIGLAIGEDDMRLRLVERHTQPSTLSLVGRGGKLKAMRGWVGHVVVDCNAPAHWLLEVAARIGLGGRTAFGFGRIRVTEC